MPSYRDLDVLVGRLKQSAIDAWMGGLSGGQWMLRPARYEMLSGSAIYFVTRPGSDGEGGGLFGCETPETLGTPPDLERAGGYEAQFAGIRATIDTIVEPWRFLPDPNEIAAVVESCKDVTVKLAGTATTSAGEAVGGGNLGGFLKSIEQTCSAMSGRTIDTFKSKFINQLGRTIEGFHAVSIVSGAAVAGQGALWKEARTTVATILDNARGKFDLVAQGYGGYWTETIKALGWVWKGVELFTGGSIPVKAASLGIQFLQSNVRDIPDVVKGFETYERGVTSLVEMLDVLNSQIRSEEQVVKDNLLNNLDGIARHKTSYDLTQFPIPPDSDVIIVNRDLTHGIARTHMPLIADELDAIATLTFGGLPGQALLRDDRIGIGERGPSSEAGRLQYLLYELLKDLAWEVRNGARNLELAVADILDHDESAARELRELEKVIEAGSPYDPWGEPTLTPRRPSRGPYPV